MLFPPLRDRWIVAALALGFGLGEVGHAAGPVTPGACYRDRERLAFVADRIGTGGLEYTPDGRLMLFYQGRVLLEGDGGTIPLATFAPDTFGSFLVLAPGGEKVIFGESTTGAVFSIAIDGADDPVEIDRISFNYDMVFDSGGRGIVSALGPNGGNQIVLLDGDPASLNPTLVVDIPGFSGPVAIDDEDNLYYGLATFGPDTLTIHRFTAEQLDLAIGGEPVSFSDGQVVADGIETVFDMIWVDGVLYYSDLGFGMSGVGRVLALDTAEGFAPSVVAVFSDPGSQSFISPSYLAFRSGSEPFRCGKGRDGGGLAVSFSDFSVFNNVIELTARRDFVRGEVNRDQLVDLTDSILILEHVFLGAGAPEPEASADTNDDGLVDLSDSIYLIEYLFLGGPEPPPPFDEPGLDPTP